MPCGVSIEVGSSRMSTFEPLPERLDDLDLLLLAERQLPDLGVGVDLDAEHRRQLRETLLRPSSTLSRTPSPCPSMRFSSTVSVGIRLLCW